MNTLQTKNRSIIALQSLFFGIQLCVASFIFAAEKTPSAPEAFFSGPLKTTETGWKVDRVTDTNNNKFILKYHWHPTAIREAVSTEIGKDVCNINRIKIFPPHDASISSVDRMPNDIKTLHIYVPGKEVGEVINDHRRKNTEHHICKNEFSIEYGLKDKETLEILTKHKDLAPIVALDIYVNNHDRHNGNIFYDEQSNHFYAIDMDRAFSDNHPLSTSTYCFVKQLNKQQLSQQKKQALIRINKTLHDLSSQFPPEKVCQLRTNFAEKAHYAYTTEEQEIFRNFVEQNFYEVKRLQERLDYVTSEDMLQLMAKKLKGPINQKNMLLFNLQKQPVFFNNTKLPAKQTISTIINSRSNLTHE
ncbi:MAG TPA: hypothetical protein VKR54_02675 [Candidatus Babeliales bacterium]|jgi:hypothetical protein|nr:hypothetical protein [Candidatus Babeliales bacterium]